MPAACWTDSNLEHAGPNSFDSSLVATFPTGYQSGHLLLVFLEINRTASEPATPSGWTRVYRLSFGGDNFMYLYGRVLDGTEGGSVSFSNADSTTEWLSATIWLDAKLDGDETGGWFDDSATVTASNIVPSMTSERRDNIYLWFGCQADNNAIGDPTGSCRLENYGRSGGDIDVTLSVKRWDTLGATGTQGSHTGSDRAAIGVLVPMNPYGVSTLRPTVGYVGFG